EIYGGIHGIDLKTREQNNIVLALFAPQIEGMAEVETPVSLIDVAPTLLGLLGEKDLGTYDGAALFDSQGRYTAPPWRRLRLESTGLIAPEKWAGSFPQIPTEELESDLSYQPNGAVRVGADYYRLIMQRKEFLNLDQIPEVLVRRKAGDEKGTSARLGLE
ncbi:MAG: hypothetical protein K8R69_08045, partial [Deltaproteobacteria bacterium]|nr:hypothetical protein [Deltaproteobacteria bacterium]